VGIDLHRKLYRFKIVTNPYNFLYIYTNALILFYFDFFFDKNEKFKDLFKGNTFIHSFEIQPSRSTRDPARPGLKLDWVEEKIKEEKTRYDPVNPIKNPIATH